MVTNLDIRTALKSPQLCMIITQEEYQDRLLGENTSLSLPTNVLWTKRGNLSFRDLANRALLCRIDAKRTPRERTFAIPDLAHQHQSELVAAAHVPARVPLRRKTKRT